MGQALRRATARVRSSSFDPSSSSQVKNVEKRPQAVPTVETKTVPKRGEGATDGSDPGGISRSTTDNVPEVRDPGYDVMLSQMVGRIRSKPGGTLEMGQAIVEKYNRPMPKLRNTKPESSRYEERPVPPGTLNVAQLRQIFLLHQGKAEDHVGQPMDAHQIAEKFRINVLQVQKILQFLSLPPEDSSNKQND